MEVVLMKGRKDVMKPLLLKLGLAFTLSISGYLYSHFRIKRIRLNRPQSPRGKDGAGGRAGSKDEVVVKHTAAEIKETPQTPHKAIGQATVGLSPTSTNCSYDDALLLPEFNDLIQKGFEETGFSPATNGVRDSDPPLVREVENVEPRRMEEDRGAMEEEILNLRNMVQELQDRERNLESQLLGYYGLKEQEALVRELQNHLKVNATETQLFTLKIESLEAENRKLQAQLSDYSKITAELESARAKIKQLQWKMKFDAEQAREQLSALHQRITALLDQEHRAALNDADIEKRLQKLKDLEGELMALHSVNSRLQCENSELALKLESTRHEASDLERSKALLTEEVNCLRQMNGDLEEEIEGIQTDRCTEIEELVYLRWVNACLRYELRNYQPTPGKSVARDLSKTLSPKSEEKAKQLILEYGNSGFDGSGIDLPDFESGYWSSSQASTLTESEIDDASIDLSSATKNNTLKKSKFISKLKRLVLGKDYHNNNNKAAAADKTPASRATSRRMASIGSLDDMMGTCPSDNASLFSKVERATSDMSAVATKQLYESSILGIPHETESRIEVQQSKVSRHHQMERLSLDLQRLRKLNLEDIKERGSNREPSSNLGSLYGYEKTLLGEGGVMELVHDNQQLDFDQDNTPEKLKMKRYAQALKGSHGNPKARRKSASFASF